MGVSWASAAIGGKVRRKLISGRKEISLAPPRRRCKLQLRALENGVQIAVVTVNYDSVGVDVPEDVAKVEKIISRDYLDLTEARVRDEGKLRLTHAEVKKRYGIK